MASTTYPGIPAEFMTRLRPSADLVERFAGTAQYHGGAQFKVKATTAKRTATTLRKAVEDLGDAASQADVEALKKAAAVLDRQAEDLALLAKWADAYHAFSEQQALDEYTAKSRTFAQQHWGDDQEAWKLEKSLLEESDTMNGTEKIGLFVLKHYPQFAGAKPENFVLGGFRSLTLKGADERTNTAFRPSMLDDRSRPYESRTYGPSASIGRDIFDAYVAHRRAELKG